MTRTSLDDISDEEFDRTVRTNLYAMFRLTKAAVTQMRPGSSIISTSSVNADQPKPFLLPYSATKAAMQNLSGGFAALLADKGIRSNIVAPGPIWTPLIVSTMPDEQVRDFGSHTPAGRPGQPAELAAVYVMLASDEASYVSGATVAVTGGVAII
jgi:NAD(P)-dependent dehydrogenase (short-subunit alcohol dehydrogenase family)